MFLPTQKKIIMEKNPLLFTLGIGLSILLVTSSCKKNLPGEWKAGAQLQKNEALNTPKPPPALCDVYSFQLKTNIFEIVPGSGSEEGLSFPKLVDAFRDMNSIQYDAQQSPVRALLSFPDSVCQFSYDNEGRLARFSIFVPAPPPGETDKYEYFWKFSYGTASTTISAGYRLLTDGNLSDEYFTGTADLYLDDAGRVVRRVYGDGAYDHYEYNDKSDLINIFSKSATGTEHLQFQFAGYDNRQCFAKTNKVWRLLLNIYSDHNPRTVTEVQNNDIVHIYTYQYNSNDLPTNIREQYNGGTNVMIESLIQYVCPN
jgi:hypothetical protein